MHTLVRTHGKDAGFQMLVKQLDAYLAVINGDKNDFFVAHNTSLTLENVVVLWVEGEAVACGAFKPFAEPTIPAAVEIKRMFVADAYRKRGYAELVLAELLGWAKELGYQNAVLETAKSMIPAVSFYKKLGFQETEKFGPYIGVETSVCFRKGIL